MEKMSKPIHKLLVASPISVARKALGRGKNVFHDCRMDVFLGRAMDYKENEAGKHFVVRKI